MYPDYQLAIPIIDSIHITRREKATNGTTLSNTASSKATVSESNLISCPEIVIVVVDPDTVGDILALLLDHVKQAHGLEVET